MKIILEINKEGLNNKQIHNTLEFLEDLNYYNILLFMEIYKENYKQKGETK